MPSTTTQPSTRLANVFVFPPERVSDPSGNVLLVANLYNFDIGRAELLPDHKLFLGWEVAPLLISNPAAGARLIGLASRSGNAWYNLQLGLQRAQNVKWELARHISLPDLANPPGPPERISVGSQGENFAARLGVADGKEESRYRAVLVTVTRDRRRPCDVRLLPP